MKLNRISTKTAWGVLLGVLLTLSTAFFYAWKTDNFLSIKIGSSGSYVNVTKSYLDGLTTGVGNLQQVTDNGATTDQAVTMTGGFYPSNADNLGNAALTPGVKMPAFVANYSDEVAMDIQSSPIGDIEPTRGYRFYTELHDQQDEQYVNVFPPHLGTAETIITGRLTLTAKSQTAPVEGGIAYFDTDVDSMPRMLHASAAGTSGQVLHSSGAGAPTWGAVLASEMQSSATDLGDADVTVVLSNSNTGNVTHLTTDGTITGASIVGPLTGNATTATNAASVTALYASNASVGNVGTGEDPLHTYTIPANTLNANYARIEFTFNALVEPAVLATADYRIKFGGTDIFTLQIAAPEPGAEVWGHGYIDRFDSDTATAVVFASDSNALFGRTPIETTINGLDFTATIVFTETGESDNAANDQVVSEEFHIAPPVKAP